MAASNRMTGVIRPSEDYVESSEALAILDVKPQTLYSYVSRGLVRRISPNGRSSFYNREDIHRLKARSKARAGHGAVAESAMHWGEPVLSTGITEITAQGPRYRAHLALDLVRDELPIEAVAEYLWSGTAPAKTMTWPVSRSAARMAPLLADLVARYPDLHVGQLLTEAVLLHAMDRESGSQRDTGRAASLSTARALIQVLCGASGLLGPKKSFIRQEEGESIASVIARALGVGDDARKVRAINAAFVLLADHEFTPATFAARIAASAGVDLHSCLGAALQVHFGAALGLRCDRMEQELLRQPSGAATSNRRVHADLMQTGFSHPLYVNGDPRAQKILELATEFKEYDSAVRATRDRLERIESRDGRLSLDAALVIFCRALGLDKPMAGSLLALGRAVGWIAHVIEQRQQDFMIRPRGRFTAAGEPGAVIRAA